MTDLEKKRNWKSSTRKQAQIVRLLVLLEFICRGRPSRSVKEVDEYMATQFGVCGRTVKRDLSTMMRVGVIAAKLDRDGKFGPKATYACNLSCNLIRAIIESARL